MLSALLMMFFLGGVIGFLSFCMLHRWLQDEGVRLAPFERTVRSAVPAVVVARKKLGIRRRGPGLE